MKAIAQPRIERFLSSAELSELLGIKRLTLYQWHRDGLIPAAKRIGRPGRPVLRWSEAEIAEWLRGRK